MGKRIDTDHRVHIVTLQDKDGPENIMYRGVGQDRAFTALCRTIISEYRKQLAEGSVKIRIEVIITS